MPTSTTSYSFQKPVFGGDTSTWGGFLNGNWDDVDDLLDGTTPVVGIDINSGSIDGAPIGATSASTGAFTTLTASGSVTFASGTFSGTLGVTGNTTLGTVSSSGLATLNAADITNNATVGGTLGVTGNSSLSTLSSSGLATLDSAAVTNNLTVSGNLGVGGAPSVSLDVSGTDAVQLASGTTAQRPTGVAGMIRWNSTLSVLEMYDGTEWTEIGAADAVVKVDSGEITVAQANLDVSLPNTTAFRSYTLVFSDLIPVDASAALDFRFRTAGGSVRAGATDYGYGGAENGLGFGNGLINQLRISGSSNVNSDGCSGRVEIYNPRASGEKTKITGELGVAASIRSVTYMGIVNTAEDNDLIRVLFSSGNIASMHWTLYGNP